MKLYHGTSWEAWRKIKREGLVPQIPFMGIEGWPEERKRELYDKFPVYMTEVREAAERFGQVVLEIDTDGLECGKLGTYKELMCDMLGIPPFHHYYGIIPPKLIKKLTVGRSHVANK